LGMHLLYNWGVNMSYRQHHHQRQRIWYVSLWFVSNEMKW
jgi:hypothetical protein